LAGAGPPRGGPGRQEEAHDPDTWPRSVRPEGRPPRSRSVPAPLADHRPRLAPPLGRGTVRSVSGPGGCGSPGGPDRGRPALASVRAQGRRPQRGGRDRAPSAALASGPSTGQSVPCGCSPAAASLRPLPLRLPPPRLPPLRLLSSGCSRSGCFRSGCPPPTAPPPAAPASRGGLGGASPHRRERPRRAGGSRRLDLGVDPPGALWFNPLRTGIVILAIRIAAAGRVSPAQGSPGERRCVP